MSYQVLARKWRPRVFRNMVGQEHVLKALINALDHDRLHHAYLFTGTRGVGKTTIARILAKCLNCEAGVSSEPCDQCASCTEINEGRFVDLIEVDAASRTKVEDTRELLDNVQYAPSKGRYKVYLIDEVHMLSGHSFNALLKTLEEPPPHIKFLLATTDPQKLPVTILSRCLQFNLKNMPPEPIVHHLEHILEREMIPFEASALWQLARAADGSMRDALSLTDQAIGFGNGKVTEADVNAMLGSIDPGQVYAMVRALQAGDGPALLAAVNAMAEHAPDFSDALADLTSILHRLAIAQVLPESIDNTFGDRDEILALAQQLPAEDVQLFYQTALLGRRDLPLAPDPKSGFEMVLLRMLAFRPLGGRETPSKGLSGNKTGSADTPPKPVKPEPAAKKPEPDPAPAEKTGNALVATRVSTPPAPHPDPAPATVEAGQLAASTPQAPAGPTPATAPMPPEPQVAKKPSGKETPKLTLDQVSSSTWNGLVFQLPIGGVIQNTLMHCALTEKQGNALGLVLDERNSTLYDDNHQQRVADALSDYFAEPVTVSIRVGNVGTETPAAQAAREKAERHANAVQTLKNDPLVRDVIETFSAKLREDSIVPIES